MLYLELRKFSMFLCTFKMYLYCQTGFSPVFSKNQDGHDQNCLAALYFIFTVLNGKDGPSSCGAFLGQMNPLQEHQSLRTFNNYRFAFHFTPVACSKSYTLSTSLSTLLLQARTDSSLPLFTHIRILPIHSLVNALTIPNN